MKRTKPTIRRTLVPIAAIVLLGAGLARADVDVQRLVPGGGGGAVSAAAQPQATGSGPGADAKAIAAWDVVPHQPVGDWIGVGVVAFHMSGIDRVEMRADGGDWVSIRRMTANPSSGAVEYWATLLAADFAADRIVQLEAVAYPTRGVPRVLEPVVLSVAGRGHADAMVCYVGAAGDDRSGDGSELRPFRTIGRAVAAIEQAHRAEGGRVLLSSGEYELGPTVAASNRERYLTIAAAPGASAEDVQVTVGGQIDTALLHLERLTLRMAGFTSRAKGAPTIWFDRCVLRGSGRFDQTVFARRSTWRGGIYATDTSIIDTANGLGNTSLLRNVAVTNIQSDAFQNAQTVINCRVDGIDKSGGKAHPDVLQWYNKGPLDNVIVYGLVARHAGAQGIAIGNEVPITNVAYVNVMIEMDPRRYVSHIAAPVDHLLMWNVSLVNRPLWVRAERMHNASIRGCVFWQLHGARDALWLDCDVRENHFITGETFGASATEGDPRWVDAADGDYRPGPASVLRRRLKDSPVPVDAQGLPIGELAAVGALQPQP